MQTDKTTAFRLGVIVLVGLAVLTAVEYAVAVFGSATLILFIIGLLKAGLIVQYYMHVTKLWSGEEGH